MPYLKTQNNVEWHYQMEGEGKPLLFIHGWSMDCRVWRQQIKFFKNYFQVMAVDLPGHGKSEWQKVSLAEMAEDVQCILEKENMKNINLVGSSFGGLVALKLYEGFSENINKISFVGSLPHFSKTEQQPYGLDVKNIRKLSGQLDTDYESILRIFFRSLFTREERNTRRFKWIQKFRNVDVPPMKEAMTEYLNILEKEDLTETLKNVRCAMQFINGEGDEICNQEAVHHLKRIASQARFDTMDKRGHLPFLCTPEDFNHILKGFLDAA